MRRFILVPLVLLLVFPASAEDLNTLRQVHQGVVSGEVRLVFDTARAPRAAVYLASHPDRLVVDLVDTRLPDGFELGDPPASGAIKSWDVRQWNLTRVRCVIRLAHRLPPSQLHALVLADPCRLVVAFCPDFVHQERFELTKGVEWIRREVAHGADYLLWNELSFNPADPAIDLNVCLAHDNLHARERVSSMVWRTHALAGVNGGFFSGAGGPLGLVVKDGRLLRPNVRRRPPRTVLGVTAQRKVEFDRVVARGRHLISRDGGTWSNITTAIGAGPRLLHRGKLALTTAAEGLGPGGNNITRTAARTAVATTRDGRVMVVTASGYSDNHRQGLKLKQLATMLLRHGASEAMNLDGGASVDMVIGDKIVSDGPGNLSHERPVGDALLIEDGRPRLYPEEIAMSASDLRLVADGRSQQTVHLLITDPQGNPVPDKTPVQLFSYGLDLSSDHLQTKDGQAQVTVRSTLHPGPAVLLAECGPASARMSFALVAGPPDKLICRQGPAGLVQPADGHGHPHQQIGMEAQVDDALGNPVNGARVVFVVNGKASRTYSCNRRGMVDTTLDLPPTGADVEVRCGALKPLQIKVGPAPTCACAGACSARSAPVKKGSQSPRLHR